MDQWLADPQVRQAIQAPVTRMGGGAGLSVVAYLGLQPSHRCPLNAKEGRLLGEQAGEPGSPQKKHLFTGCT